jgi:hypothetical protein
MPGGLGEATEDQPWAIPHIDSDVSVLGLGIAAAHTLANTRNADITTHTASAT